MIKNNATLPPLSLEGSGEASTICALATAPGGAIAVIRVSGDMSFDAVSSICSRVSGCLLLSGERLSFAGGSQDRGSAFFLFNFEHDVLPVIEDPHAGDFHGEGADAVLGLDEPRDSPDLCDLV